MTLSPDLLRQALNWRHQFHQMPELGYQEHRTSDRIAEVLAQAGLEVHRGLAGTGVIGTLRNGEGKTIGLRADMDALPITEQGSCEWRSAQPGVMHACGHDGHSAILLAAACQLAATRRFSGTLHFIFQPAEENLGGAGKMIEQGLFQRFPMDAVYALHNWPGLPVGTLAINPGTMLASLDTFEITLSGKSCHAAMPERGADPMIAAAELILALQTIPSRRLSPLASAVISVTQIQGGEAINVIADKLVMRGTLRCLQGDVRRQVRQLIDEFTAALPQPFGVSGEIEWLSGYPVTVNHREPAEHVRAVAQRMLGDEQVHWQVAPSMASEDFACMLEVCPGAYFFLGADGDTPSAPLHNARYDFNDDLIPLGVSFWQQLVEQSLPQNTL